MSLVYLVYALVIFQAVLFLLHFTGKGYIILLILEVAQLPLRLLFHVFHSAFKWTFPSKKSLQGELALVTGAASGIGRLISLILAKKGSFCWCCFSSKVMFTQCVKCL